jgi:hypothetical protein
MQPGMPSWLKAIGTPPCCENIPTQRFERGRKTERFELRRMELVRKVVEVRGDFMGAVEQP